MSATRFRLRLFHLFCLVALSVVLSVGSGCATRPAGSFTVEQFSGGDRQRAERNLKVFYAAWDLVNRKHYEPKTRGPAWEKAAREFAPRAAAAEDDAALSAVINEMFAVLRDSHTHVLTPEQAIERKTRERARTGFSMARIDSTWVVTDVLPDSPAGRAGVMSGWVVVTRNGAPLGPRPDFRAYEGEEVRWVFLDPTDKKIELTVEARKLPTASLQVSRVLPGGFVYLRFDEFDTRNRRWLSERLREHATAPGVVVDLRRNPGGETFSLGIAVGEFFERGVDCGTFISRAGARKVKNSWQLGSANYRGRVVVLVDASSASASEIFAAVMQDHGRATVVGRETAGAVLASWFYRLPYGWNLQLSREDYVTPKGRRVEGNGVKPDVLVTRTVEDMRAGRDPDLDAALRILNGS